MPQEVYGHGGRPGPSKHWKRKTLEIWMATRITSETETVNDELNSLDGSQVSVFENNWFCKRVWVLIWQLFEELFLPENTSWICLYSSSVGLLHSSRVMHKYGLWSYAFMFLYIRTGTDCAIVWFLVSWQVQVVNQKGLTLRNYSVLFLDIAITSWEHSSKNGQAPSGIHSDNDVLCRYINVCM